MKYAIYGKVEDKLIHQKLSCFENDEINPDIVFSFGGDGTMLGSIRRYQHLGDNVRFIGINTGRLGFYTDFKINDIDYIIEMLINKNFETTKFSLLEYNIKTKEKEVVGLALNEIAITNPIHTQIIDVYIAGELFEVFRGTGFLISTPSGSTAYNKSLGGSIIEPSIKAIQLTEIASINNRVYKTLSSPLVLSKDTVIELRSENYDNIYLSVDGNYLQLDNIISISGKLSNREVTFIVKKNRSFLHRVKRAFID